MAVAGVLTAGENRSWLMLNLPIVADMTNPWNDGCEKKMQKAFGTGVLF